MAEEIEPGFRAVTATGHDCPMKGTRRVRTAAAAAVLLLASAGCGSGRAARRAAGDTERHLRSGGRDRTYRLHLPQGRTDGTGLPVVIMLHGRGGTAEGMEKLTHFDQIADHGGFVAVYPQGWRRSWADARGTTPAARAGVDDRAFIAALIDSLVRRDHVDRSRIYVTGLSNGAMMTETLGCALADRIAGIAPVGGPLPAGLDCRPSRSVPVLEIHGTADPLVPYTGGPMGRGGARGSVLSAEATAAAWRRLDRCGGRPAEGRLPDRDRDGTHVRTETATGCPAHVGVAFYTVDGGGHTWPGGEQYAPVRIVGRTSRQFDAGRLIWDFFARLAG